MKTKRIVLIGGPGTGKTSLLNELQNRGFTCYEEVSRQVTKAAQEQGIAQLFLSEPLKFSELLLEARIEQHKQVGKESSELVFIDRGIPDVLAYMDYAKSKYPEHFEKAAENYRYDHVFSLAPWEAIFESDNERYENFEQAQDIHQFILKSYENYGYHSIAVPFDSVSARADFLLNILNK